MAGNKPLWRRGVEAVDRVASPVVEGATRHEAFKTSVSLIQRSRRAVFRRTERMSRRWLHQMNLPTASDVNRLLLQIAAVENRVRTLNRMLEDQANMPSGERAPSGRERPHT
jgi:hypothetical protein